MKLIVMALLTFLLPGVGTQAGEFVPGITGKGIKLGAAWANVSTNDSVFEEGTAGGFTAGAFLTYSFTPKLSVQPELLYVEKGTAHGSFLGGSGYDLSYVEVPVLLKYTLLTDRRLVPSAYFGPAVSSLLSADIYSHGLFSSSHRYDVKDGMKSLDFGIVFGGEIAIQSMKSVKLIADLRYTVGLVNVIDPAKWNAARKIADEGDWGPLHWTEYDRPIVRNDASVKNRAFSIMLGVRF